MPRLSFERGNVNLTWALQNLGLSDLFKPGYAQLYDVSDYKWLSVSDIIHKTYLDIKENSLDVEKSTVTFPSPSSSSSAAHHPSQNAIPKQKQQPSMSEGQSINVNFDKPFIYFVFDNISGLVMVMGKVGTKEPTSKYRLPI